MELGSKYGPGKNTSCGLSSGAGLCSDLVFVGRMDTWVPANGTAWSCNTPYSHSLKTIDSYLLLWGQRVICQVDAMQHSTHCLSSAWWHT
eukprot:639054-Amphidinium_carterae.1